MLSETSGNTALWSWWRVESQKSKDIASLCDFTTVSQQVTIVQPSSIWLIVWFSCILYFYGNNMWVGACLNRHTHRVPTSSVLCVNHDISTSTSTHLVSPHTSRFSLHVFNFIKKCSYHTWFVPAYWLTRHVLPSFSMEWSAPPATLMPNIQQPFIYGEGLGFKVRFREKLACHYRLGEIKDHPNARSDLTFKYTAPIIFFNNYTPHSFPWRTTDMTQLLQNVSYELAMAFVLNSAKKNQLNSNIQHKSTAPHKASSYFNYFREKKKGKKLFISILHPLENEHGDSSTEVLFFTFAHLFFFS